ncbi:hypothetical protein SAMN05192574_105244 [Mucilaginibacter gossypiicola]|uniref:Uncharacterized protein n=1 Tax=Mucilaginibacter gossypiicola TaxID=551995 RepID=A0A1H8LTR8_9SPHI|nr:hypothetical protein [Mucilaginibacter gossypiicola]SEO08453.1 hypothetical protein SAMN05192574_105244 [Mucilaginibacter gossypiicola]
MKQTVLTFIADIKGAETEKLKEVFAVIHANLLKNPYISFQEVTLVHFASFVIANEQSANPQLIFENNFDGDVSVYLDELTTVAGHGLHEIYRHCKGYDQQAMNAGYISNYLQSRIVRPNAFHIGNVGREAKVVRENQLLRETLQQNLDNLFSRKPPASYTAPALRKDLLATIPIPQALPPHQSVAEKVLPWVKLVLFGLVCGPLLIIPALVAIPILRRLEKTDIPDDKPASAADISQFIITENQITQNHLAVVTDIKSPKFRLYLLKFVLFAINLIARTATKGKLSGIPSIHFAHWSVINNGQQMLFLSNYDGSWISYLDDFIDKAARGLTGIWSNSKGFPSTRFLILDGARDELQFKAYSRNHQVPSLVWYSAYRDLTVQNIDKDSKIREAIPANLTDTETEAWLKLF